MADSFDLVIHGGECLTPAGRLHTDVGVRGGRIAALGDLGAAATAETFDAGGLTVLPGVIDTQVHFREPGQEHKEDLASGTRAAALGGVTAVFEMPNTRPSTTDAAALADKVVRAQGRVWCDIAFFMGASPENAGDLATLERVPGCCGVKMFMGSSTGTLLVSEDADIRRVLENGSRRIAVHSEDEARLEERKHIARDASGPHAHAEWRDAETALRSTKRLLKLARQAGRPVHVLHVTTGDEIPVLAAHKDIATVEVTPQHLTLAAPEVYDRLGTLAQMNPPIRDEAHRTALWQAVADGVVDVIGSDHAPHSLEEKGHAYPNSPSGMPGVQTLVAVLLDHVNAGRLTLERFVDLTSAGPQRIYNIAGKGRIAVGYDADFTIVDMKAQRTIENAWIASKCGWTPFDGMRVTGWPRATVVRGAIVMREDELAEAPSGGIVRFVGSGHQ
ncbi:MAG TPA: dihydroorotase [Alphaproteobacteria bacterium]|nr:dihydroorotase [Alphaproteobacteria bacterium]